MEQTGQASSHQKNTKVQNKVKRILYATDLSPEAPQVYQYVLFVANQFGAAVTCLHVIDQPSKEAQLALATYLSKDRREELTSKNLQEAMAEMLRRDEQDYIRQTIGSGDELNPKELGITSVKKVVNGNVEEQILEQSEKIGADLVILGAHRKPNSDTYFNSISKRVLRRSKVPVTIVPIVD